MPTPFEGVREALLRAGVAPRHARRYVTELREHLTDRTAQERDAGYGVEEAVTRARAFLGTDAELAQALIDRGDFRSVVARAPWAIFVVLPLVVLYAVDVAMVWIGLMSAQMSSGYPPSIPPSTRTLAVDIYIWVAPLAAVGCIIVALRQRMSPLWPVIGLLHIGTFMYVVPHYIWFDWHASRFVSTILISVEAPVRGILLFVASSTVCCALRRHVPWAVVAALPLISFYLSGYVTKVMGFVPVTALWIAYVATDALGLLAVAACVVVALRQTAVALHQRVRAG